MSLFLSGSMSFKLLKSLMLLKLFKFKSTLSASSAGFINNSFLLFQYFYFNFNYLYAYLVNE